MAIDKKTLSEADIRTKYITPAIEQSGWDKMSQMREEYSITAGRIIARGQVCKREKPLKADYVLFYKPNKPIAIVEAKDNNDYIYRKLRHSAIGSIMGYGIREVPKHSTLRQNLAALFPDIQVDTAT